MDKRSFTVLDRYIVEIAFPKRGPDIYTVDGREVLRRRTFNILRPKQTISLNVGPECDSHCVEIRINLWPMFRSWRTDNWIAEVYVDGALAIADFTPEDRKTITKWERICDRALFAALAIGLVFMVWRRLC